MKYTSIGLAAVWVLLAAAGTASAADMPVKAAPYAGCGPAQFAGFYIGGNVGGIAYTGVRQDQDQFLIDNADNTHTKLGWTAGVQAGWDWQHCNKVFGVVADWNWAGAKGSIQQDPNFPALITDFSTAGKLKWFSTVRGRAGLAVDDMLVYVTGGLAIADIDTTVNRFLVGLPSFGQTFSKTRLGLAVGAGAEYKIAPHWSANAEVLYLQFEKQSYQFTFPPSGAAPFHFENQDKAWVSRVGLNYRWNDAAPVKAAPARYAGGSERFGGFYIGGNAGSVSYTALRYDQDGLISDNAEYGTTKSGFTGGAQIGWDWQRGSKLAGIVADFNGAGVTAEARQNPNAAVVNQFTSGKLKWFGTVRGRAGLAVDDVLVYVTGGLAYAGIDTTIHTSAVAPNEQFNFSDTRWGWVGGVGAEAALGHGWSIMSELLYMQFKKSNETFFVPALGGSFAFENNDSAWVSRLGVNYRWNNTGPAPASRYAGPMRFDGIYLGANAGGVAYTSVSHDQDGYFVDNSQYAATKFTGTVGGQVGWDWQKGHRLFGVVADFNWTNAETSTAHQPNAVGTNFTNSSKLSWFGTARTRGGLVVDDVLVYVTGGLAAGQFKTSYVRTPPAGESFSFDNTRWGWTGGIGAEYALWGNWHVNAEALYMQFGRHTDTFFSPAQARGASFEANDSAIVARLGLNYRFNQPMVAGH